MSAINPLASSSATAAASATTNAGAIAAAQAAYDAAHPAAATTASAAAATGNAASSQLAGNYETFIKLLTSQLQNQDPLQPTDTAAFTQQLVQYSQVEQQISTNSKLDGISAGLTNTSATQYVNYIGKSVSSNTDQIQLSGSKAAFGYTLPDNADKVTVNILGANNAVIASSTGDTTLGAHEITWDGTLKDGSTVTDGTYKVQIVATDKTGAALKNVTQYFKGTVTGVESGSGGVQLDFGGLKIDPTKVVAIESI